MQVYNFNNCYNQAKNILGNMEVKNDLIPEPPTLYKSWITSYSSFQKKWKNGLWADFFKETDIEASKFFSFEQNLEQAPVEWEFNQMARNDLIKCMSIAIKCHFFLFNKDVLAEPPSIIQIPDLNNLNIPRFALIYSFLASKHALIVSRADLSSLSSTALNLVKFPVIISKNPKYWLNHAYWKKLMKEGDELQMMLRGNKDQIHQWKDKKTFPYGHILDISQQHLQEMRQTGIRWADGIKSWYLPKGYDLPPVLEYLSYLNDQAKKAFLSWNI